MRQTLKFTSLIIGAILFAISGGIIGTYITLWLNLQPNSTTYVLRTETNTRTKTNELHIASKESIFLDTPKTVYVQNNLTVSGSLTVEGTLEGTLLEPISMQNGGTGATSFTSGGVVYSTGSTLTASNSGLQNQLLTISQAGIPTFVTLSGDLTMSGSTLTVNVGSITATKIASDAITNTHISSTAGIVDTKLAVISTTGKVANSATTATPNDVPLTIVSRDSIGNFAANSITSTLFTGTLSGAASANVLKTGDTLTGTLTLTPTSGKALAVTGTSGTAAVTITPEPSSTALSIATTTGNALEINTDKFTIAGSTGNTTIAGSLSVTSLTAGRIAYTTTNGTIVTSDLLRFDGTTAAVGTNFSSDTRLMVTGIGDTSSTYGFRITNGAGSPVFRVRDDRYIETFGMLTATNNDGVNYAATIKHNGGTVARHGLLINTTGTSGTTTAFKVETGALTDAFMLRADGTTAIGTAATNNIRLLVRSSGTTSATTGLRVEDSAGTALLTVRSDGLLTVTGSITVTNGLTVSGGTTTIAGPTRFTPSATQTVTASSNTLTAGATTIRVAGSGGNITLSGVATIAAGVDGQILFIVGSSDTNTVTLTAGATETLVLGTATRILGKDDVLQLMYNSSSNRWIEVTFANNTTN